MTKILLNINRMYVIKVHTWNPTITNDMKKPLLYFKYKNTNDLHPKVTPTNNH